MGKAEGRRPHGKLRSRLEVNIEMDLSETGWGTAWAELIWLSTGTGGRML